jgi:Fic family protein
VDGNGRTARVLFYWSMLHEDYWLAEFLPISRLLARALASTDEASCTASRMRAISPIS